jgi:hypothetical protein
MNAITTTSGNGSGLIPQNIADAMRLAEMMAKGKMVPEHLRNPSDMLMVIEQACRWGMSPFAVAQCTAIVRGRISYEGKLVSAAINASGILQGRLDYEFSGEGAARAVTARGTLRGEDKPREVVVTLASAKTDNEHWKKSPDQMLTYHAARVWARRHAPEVMLGVYSPEEFDAQTARDTFRGTTLDAVAPHDPAPPERQTVQHAAGTPDPVAMVPGHPKPRQTAAEWLDEIAAELAATTDGVALDAILDRPKYQQMRGWLTGSALDRLIAIEQATIERIHAAETSAPEDDGLYADPASDPFRETAPA